MYFIYVTAKITLKSEVDASSLVPKRNQGVTSVHCYSFFPPYKKRNVGTKKVLSFLPFLLFLLAFHFSSTKYMKLFIKLVRDNRIIQGLVLTKVTETLWLEHLSQRPRHPGKICILRPVGEWDWLLLGEISCKVGSSPKPACDWFGSKQIAVITHSLATCLQTFANYPPSCS